MESASNFVHSPPTYVNDPNVGYSDSHPPPPDYGGPSQPRPSAGGFGYYPQYNSNQVAPYSHAYPPPPAPPQQQQHSMVVFSTGNAAPMIIQEAVVESYCGYQVLACLVFWFCNVLFGLIAWILALVAESTKYSDREQARRLGKASLGMSISGIIVSVVIVAIVLGLIFGTVSTAVSGGLSSCYYGYTLNGLCYSSRRYVGSSCYSYYSCCYTSSEDAYSNYYCYTL
jgi:uncharacterized Tic20 family protein